MPDDISEHHFDCKPDTPTNWEEEFDRQFNLPITDEAHRHLNSPTSKNVYYDNTRIKSFIRTLLVRAREEGPKAIEADFDAGFEAGRAEALREEVTRLEGWLDDGRALGDIIKERLNYLKKG